MVERQDAEALAGLVAQVRADDDAAARELVERLYPLVARVVHSHLPRRDEPEDLMQEVFLKMFSKLEQYRGEVPFEHWVSRLARTTCFDRLRRQRARPELRWADLSEEEQVVLEHATKTEEPLDADAPQALELLTRLLDQLPANDAWLLREVELEQKTLAEVCAQTGWNAGAARVRLFRARHRLQKAFRKMERS
jgi:RNA polymerase sigma factor (sigma-70 family)